MDVNPIAAAVLFAFAPASALLFLVLPPRRALLLTVFVGCLLLPQGVLSFPGLPDFSRREAVAAAVLLGLVLSDHRRLMQLRLRMIDVPILVFCLEPILVSISNDLGVYDGLSSVFGQASHWTVLYFAGRIYLGDLPGCRLLCRAFLTASLLYLPLVWMELRLSPQLHRWIYGYHGFRWNVERYGGYRPTVFLENGLLLGLLLASASLVAFYLWKTRALTSVARLPLAIVTLLLVLSTLLSKAITAITILSLGIGVMLISTWLRTRIAILAVIALPVLYAANSALWNYGEQSLVSMVAAVDDERATSLQIRFENQARLSDKAMERPLLGWGGWGRSRVLDEKGRDVTLSDGVWIVVLGTQGLIGLVAYLMVFLMPAVIVVAKIPPSYWALPRVAPALAVTVVVVVNTLEMSINGGDRQLLTLFAGAVAGLANRLLANPSMRTSDLEPQPGNRAGAGRSSATHESPRNPRARHSRRGSADGRQGRVLAAAGDAISANAL